MKGWAQQSHRWPLLPQPQLQARRCQTGLRGGLLEAHIPAAAALLPCKSFLLPAPAQRGSRGQDQCARDVIRRPDCPCPVELACQLLCRGWQSEQQRKQAGGCDQARHRD